MVCHYKRNIIIDFMLNRKQLPSRTVMSQTSHEKKKPISRNGFEFKIGKKIGKKTLEDKPYKIFFPT